MMTIALGRLGMGPVGAFKLDIGPETPTYYVLIPATDAASAGSPAPLGFIVTGMGGPYLQHVLFDLGLSGLFPVLQMGMSYPVDVEMVKEFSATCRNMIVIEERRSFLERNIRDGLFHVLPQQEATEICSRLFGKMFPDNKEGIPESRGLNFSVLAQRIIPLIQSTTEIDPQRAIVGGDEPPSPGEQAAAGSV